METDAQLTAQRPAKLGVSVGLFATAVVVDVGRHQVDLE
jgi:hypothetical protein